MERLFDGRAVDAVDSQVYAREPTDVLQEPLRAPCPHSVVFNSGTIETYEYDHKRRT